MQASLCHARHKQQIRGCIGSKSSPPQYYLTCAHTNMYSPVPTICVQIHRGKAYSAYEMGLWLQWTSMSRQVLFCWCLRDVTTQLQATLLHRECACHVLRL